MKMFSVRGFVITFLENGRHYINHLPELLPTKLFFFVFVVVFLRREYGTLFALKIIRRVLFWMASIFYDSFLEMQGCQTG